MKFFFKILEKEWNQALHKTYKKLASSLKNEVLENVSYVLEYLTIKKIIKKELKPKLIVINGPACAGKSTVGKILEKFNFQRIPRITDRAKRRGEIDGKDYHFVDTITFNTLLKSNMILAGKTTYGFSRGFFKKNFKQLASTVYSKKQYYTEGDSSLQAFKEAENIFKLSPKIVLNIFILPPSFRELYRRLSNQYKSGNFTKEEFKTRLIEGIHYLTKSINHFKDFPNSLFIVNDDVNRIDSIFSLFEIKNNTKQVENIISFLNGKKKLQGITTKNYAHQAGLLHPISVIYVFNSRGKLIIQKRSDSGLWDHSAAGHLNIGETHKNAAQRELAEELGISNVSLSFLGSGIMTHSLIPIKTRHYFNLFTCSYDGQLKIQTDEVLEVDYVSLKELEKRLLKEPETFSGGFHATYKYFSKLAKK